MPSDVKIDVNARDEIDLATDVAAGVNNTYGGSIYEGRDRDTIELGLRRLTSAGYRLVAPGQLDNETIEAAATRIGDYDPLLAEHIRSMKEKG